MSSFMLEITFFIFLLAFTTVLILFRNSLKNRIALPVVLVTLVLIDLFVIIHIVFCYQVGFPASTTQDNQTDLLLTSSDWLGFLGGYLGFAGSLVMAYLVYRQSEVINKFTISEYRPSASLIIQDCVKSSEHDNYIKDNIIQCRPNDPEDHYYTLYYYYIGNQQNELESDKILFFIEIINNSKLPISNISFSTITLEEFPSNSKQYEYKNYVFQDKALDPIDGLAEILPGGKVKRCLVIDNIPRTINIGWITINLTGFSCGKNHSFSAKVLVSKEEGHNMTLLRESNSFIVSE